jgi:hypothetical protein
LTAKVSKYLFLSGSTVQLGGILIEMKAAPRALWYKEIS